MAITIGKLGIIKGGACEKRFQAKAKRERGVDIAMQYLIDNKCIITNHGWSQIVRIPSTATNMRWIIRNVCKLWGGDVEIGWRRFIQEIAIPLYDSKKKFRMSHLKKWGQYTARSEFSLGSTIAIGTFCYNEGPYPDCDVIIGNRVTRAKPSKLNTIRPIRQEDLYEKWKAGGN